MANRFLNGINVNDSYTLPSTDGNDGEALITDGAGNISFGPVSASDSEAVHLAVKNTSGTTITKGTPVYITGNVGNSDRLEVAPADASDVSKMPAVGLLESDLANNAEGYVAQGGYLKGLSTATIDGTSTSSNDTVYVKAGGGLTMTKPTGANYIQNVAKVARVHASSGSLVVSSILRTNDVPTPLYIDHSNQRLGIGTTSPSEKLEVNGNVESNTLILNGGGSNPSILMERANGADIPVFQLNPATDNLTIGNTGIDEVIFHDDSGEAMRLDGTGNLGIGTTSPFTNLTIYGATDSRIALVNASTGSTSADGFVLIAESDGDVHFLNRENSDMFFSTNGSKRMTILSDGKVGIGTTSPERSLHVNGSTSVSAKIEGSNSGHLVDLVNGNASPQYNGLRFYQGTDHKMSISHISDGTTKGYMQIGNNWATGSEILVVDGRTSNVGIGTTSPSSKLEVKHPQGTSGAFYQPSLLLSNSSQTDSGGLTSIALSTSTAPKYGYAISTERGVNGATSDLVITHHNNSLTGTERMRIASSGRVGIGTDLPAGKLEINGGTGVATSGGTLIVRQDGDTSSDGIALTSSNSISHRMFKNATGTFLMGPSTNSDAFALDLNGNVGIGETSPDTQLHIKGASNASTRIRLELNDSGNSINLDQEYGGIEWAGNDGQGDGVRADIRVFGEGASGETYMTFGTKVAGFTGSTSATERMRIDSDGTVKVINTLEFGSLKDSGEDITITKFVDEADSISSNNNDTTIPTSAAVDAHINSKSSTDRTNNFKIIGLAMDYMSRVHDNGGTVEGMEDVMRNTEKLILA